MRLHNYLNEKTSILNQSIKSKINREISDLLKPTYFNKIPLQPLFDILKKYGLIPLQEDRTYWDGFLLGGVKNTEQVYFDLGWESTKNERNQYEVIRNASLALSYYKMPESGRYEVIAYIG